MWLWKNCQDLKTNSKVNLIGTDHNYILFPGCLCNYFRISESKKAQRGFKNSILNSFVNRCLKDDDIGFSALRILRDSFGAGGHGEFLN